MGIEFPERRSPDRQSEKEHADEVAGRIESFSKSLSAQNLKQLDAVKSICKALRETASINEAQKECYKNRQYEYIQDPALRELIIADVFRNTNEHPWQTGDSIAKQLRQSA